MSDISRPSRSGALLVLVVAILAGAGAVARHAPFVDEPFDDTLASINGAYYMGRIARCWQRIGFAEMKGEPCLAVIPSNPEMTPPPHRWPYLHHPPVYPWLIHLSVARYGETERALRGVAIAFTALTAFVLACLAGRLTGVIGAAVASVVFLCTPMGFFYGWMSNPESSVLFFIVLSVALHEWLRDKGLVGRVVVGLSLLCATQLDWQGSFAAASLLALELMRKKEGRRLLPTFIVCAVTGITTAVITLGFYSWWVGGVTEALDHVFGVAGASNMAKGGTADWFRNQVVFWGDLYGWPLTIVATTGLFWLPYRVIAKGDGAARVALALFLPGVLNVAVFRKHAFDHDFWWFYAQAYVALTAALMVRSVSASRIGRWIVMVILAGTVGWNVVNISDLRKEWAAPTDKSVEAEKISTILGLGPDDVLARAGSFSTETFYYDAWLIDRIDDPQLLQDLVNEKVAGKLSVGKLVYLVDTNMPGMAGVLEKVQELATAGIGQRLERGGVVALIIP